MEQCKNGKVVNDSESQDSVFIGQCEEQFEGRVEVLITSIENIVSLLWLLHYIAKYLLALFILCIYILMQIRNGSLRIKVVVEHEDLILGESKLKRIYCNYENISKVHTLDFAVTLPYCTDDMQSIVPMVSSPVLSKYNHTYPKLE